MNDSIQEFLTMFLPAIKANLKKKMGPVTWFVVGKWVLTICLWLLQLYTAKQTKGALAGTDQDFNRDNYEPEVLLMLSQMRAGTLPKE